MSGVFNIDRDLPNRRRGGFTLLEILLVLTIIVIAFSMAMPALRGPMETQRLRTGAERVRIAWSKARLNAMRDGVTYAYYFAPGGNQFSVSTFGADVPPPEFSSDENATAIDSENALPEGVTFGNIQFGRDDRQASMSASTGQASSSPTGDAYEPILFYPDGTTSSVQLTVIIDSGQQILVELRGLTGVARVGAPETVEER